MNSYSLVKTLVGALVLRAHADGRIDTLDLSLDAVIGPQAPQVSVRDALTMTTGLSLRGDPPKASAPKPFDDAGFSAFGPVARLHAFGIDRAVPNIERRPDLAGQFRYQSVNTALLGLVLEQAYQRPLPEILDDLIWRPAGAASARWRRPPGASRVSAYCCLYARAWDWLQVGRFLLNNGTAEAPFLPDDLWQSWILPDLDPATRRKGHYGLHIRHDVLDRDGEDVQGPFAYLAGHGGQIVYLLPHHDAVVVRFGDTPQRLHSTLYDVLGPP